MIVRLGLIACLAVLVSGAATGQNGQPRATEAEFVDWHATYNAEAERRIFAKVTADWQQNTNVTETNTAIMIEAGERLAEWSKAQNAEMKARFSGVTFTPGGVNERLYSKLSKVGDAALTSDEFKELSEIKAKMEGIYSTAKVCRDQAITDMTQCPAESIMTLEPHLNEILDKSRDYDQLLYVWKSWRDVSGKNYREEYKRYIDLKNKAAVADGYINTASAWRAPYVEPAFNYTDPNFMAEITAIWNTLRPLYEQLHAYVRSKLVTQYGEDHVNPIGPIPAHLLGNMWAQTWLGVQNFSTPYQGKPALDVTEEMVRQNWNARRMFDVSDKFFEDLGLTKMPNEFWTGSMIEKPPPPTEVVCHASAWDFYNRVDFRVKQCTAVNMQDLFTVHHEMGHIEYYLNYKDQPVVFREGANDGFHEAIGDTLTLSVSTPKHLQKMNLLTNYNDSDTELDINFMYTTALEKIAFLPFGLALDLYRYDVFSGAISKDQLNEKWWQYVMEYQGVCAPLVRNESDFDPGSKFHVPADVPYMRYFVSFIIQFQFHEAMCKAANHTGPLYKCDIDGSKAAGAIMADALSMGSSRPWQEVMRVLTGGTKMDARPLVEYFEPLYRWLAEENARLGNFKGWTRDLYCPTKGAGPAPTTPSSSASQIWASSAVILTTVVAASFF